MRDAVKCDSEAAADHQPAAEVMPGNFPWTPRKTELRSKVRFLGFVLVAARAYTHVGELVGPAAEHHGGQFAVLLRNRSKVLPSQTGGHRQVGPHLVIVLEEKPHDIVSQVLAESGGHTGLGIGLHALLYRCIVQEVPNIVESVAGTIGPERSVNGEQPGKLAPHLHRVRAVNFGEHILCGVRPLVKAVERADSIPNGSNAPRAVEPDLRQSERAIGIACEILVDPAGRIDACLVDQGGAEGVIP